MKIRCRVAMVTLTVFMIFLATTARAADVLDQVPAGAMVVIKVNHLKQTSDKISEMVTALGGGILINWHSLLSRCGQRASRE